MPVTTSWVLLLLSNRKTCKRKAGIELGRSCISGKPIASLMSMPPDVRDTNAAKRGWLTLEACRYSYECAL